MQEKLDNLINEAVSEDNQSKRATVIIEYGGRQVTNLLKSILTYLKKKNFLGTN